VIGYACGHGWRDPQGFVDAAEVIVHVVQRDRMGVVLKLLAESIG
jgi:hypothetical protein